MRLGVILAVLAFVIGIPWWVVNGSRSWPRTYHYRLTLYVDTPEGPRIGSNVIEVDTRFYDGIFDNAERTLFGGLRYSRPEFVTTVKGEATIVDLGSRGALFALLIGERYRIGRNYRYKPFIVADWVFPLWYYAGTIGLDGKYRAYLDELERRKPKEDVELTYVPMLVRFDDLTKPNSVKLVDPFNLAESFGPGVGLKRASFEITDEPVTSGISDRLPWLKNDRSNASLFASDSQGRPRAETAQIETLTYYDFQSGPR
jgi:hypothetical protein